MGRGFSLYTIHASLQAKVFSMESLLHFRILAVGVGFECPDEYLRSVLLANYGAFRADGVKVDLLYVVERVGTEVICRARRHTGEAFEPVMRGEDLYSFVYDIEKDITLELQRRRNDLYFIHGAVLEHDGGALLLAAESGTGKSTTAWALAAQGLSYLSDELAPIDPQALTVYPYPHALCLKSEPPAPYVLPADILSTGRTLHVPVPSLPCPMQTEPRPLLALFFLTRKPDAVQPAFRALSTAETATRLYANTLNALAHAGSGLDTALHISDSVPAFLLEIGDLRATCELIIKIADDVALPA